LTERLYTLRHSQGPFETGVAGGRQVLLGNTVHDIVAHWFDRDGQFLALERFRMDVDPPTLPGAEIYQPDSDYHRQAEREMAALKERLGFEPADIRVRAFESEEAAIADMPGEYVEYLEADSPPGEEDRAFFEEAIEKWRRDGNFVLSWYEQYWVSAAGEVIAS